MNRPGDTILRSRRRFRSRPWGWGLGLVLTTAVLRSAPSLPPSPDQVYGPLFAAVQRAHVFPDQKTFVDCVPRISPGQILAEYEHERTQSDFDLSRFVRDRFLVPETTSQPVPPAPSLSAHLAALWSVLRRAPDRPIAGSSLLPLPAPYVVPGGRFREMYYWDSYFTLLGLHASGHDDLVRSMVDDFAHELATYGLIPNGNRTYYLSRSQPPFFALMVDLVAKTTGPDAYRRYRPALEAEYAYWMDHTFPTQHVVRLPDGAALNRYWDRADSPRPEAFATDEAEARRSHEPAAVLYRNLRSAAESGWDFSSRWFTDGRSLATIDTTNVVPVDLNCLLGQLERTLAKARRADGDVSGAAELERAAEQRAAVIRRACWSNSDGWFCDFDLHEGKLRPTPTLAGVVPLFLRVATPAEADAAARTIEQRFLRPGGVVTTLSNTGQQWDAPNGWAPLEWMAIEGLRNYGHDTLAAKIARRWIALNRDVYARTGKLMEKYNVEDVSLLAGGGEYPSQDGFGWTNGVLLALAAEGFPLTAER